jgi:hypothetical protein
MCTRGSATTGVDSVTFQTAFETTLAAVAGESVTVIHVDELAVSAA